MAAAPTTAFSRDVLGRYVGNDLNEAKVAMSLTGARPFDVIVVGGGSFAGVFAQHLFGIDAARRHRVLVLEAGPMVLGEHVQNLPMIGLNQPAVATSIAALRAAGQFGPDGPRNEVWACRGTPRCRSPAWPIALVAGRCIGAAGPRVPCPLNSPAGRRASWQTSTPRASTPPPGSWART